MSDDKQLELPLSASEKWAWLRTADFGLRPSRERNLHDLLDRLAAKAERNFYTPTRDELAADMRVSLTTVRNTIRDAVELGILATVERKDPIAGRLPNEYRIDWRAVYTFTPAGKAKRAGLAATPARRASSAARPSPRPARAPAPTGGGTQPGPGEICPSPGGSCRGPGEICPPINKDPSVLPSIKLSPTPLPPLAAGDNGGDAGAWRRVGEELLRIGLRSVAEWLELAQARGFTPDLARRWVEHWEAKRPAWEAAALLWTLRNTPTAVEPAAAAWPDVSPAYRVAAARQRREDERARIAAEERAAAARDAQRLEELRRQYGDEVERLDQAARLELALAAFGPMITKRIRTGSITGEALDRLLLEALARQRSPPRDGPLRLVHTHQPR